MEPQPLILNEWADAIGDSPNVGLGYVKNASIDAVPGSVMPNYAPVLHTVAPGTSTFTWNVSGYCALTTSGTSLETDGVAVTFSTAGGGTLDTAVVAGTIYFLYKLATGQVIIADTLAHALAHSPMVLNSNGSGTCTVTTVDMGTPNSLAQGNSVVYVADSNGRVWFDEGAATYLLAGNTITNGTGKGLAWFRNSDSSGDFLFVFRNATIDVCNVTTQARRQSPTSTSSWSSAWNALNTSSGTSNPHQAVVGQDNIVYACDANYIVSILEIPGSVFAPGSSGTYTYNSKALTLPTTDIANCLEQLGVNLLVGGLNSNFIYPWPRNGNPSFELPLVCPEVGVYGMKNIGNTVYILNGLRGIIYKTTGYLVTQHRKLPEALLQGTSGASNLVTWGGVGSKNGAFMFGLTALNTAIAGVWLTYSDGRLVQENTPSGGAARATVLSQSAGEFYYIGSAGALDLISTNRYGTLASVVVQSRLYNVGNKITKAKYSRCEVQLDQPGGSGGSVRVSYRPARSGSFTVIDTYSLDGTTQSFTTDCGLIDLENIQVQVEIATNGTGSNAASVREVRLIP